MKIGRNHPCPCGSNEKYKHCCGRDESKSNAFAIDEETTDKINEFLQKEKEREDKYGRTRPIIHGNSHGYKLVAVGNQAHWSKQWRTFIDFLWSYIAHALGSSWGQEELAKPSEEQHQIIKWCIEAFEFQNKQSIPEDGVSAVNPCGALKAYIHLAYDLYILRHHSAIQEDVIRRLKHKEQFQGARYELFVASTCIKAGYTIEYEDEKDRNKTHVEFIATHDDNGQQVCVEAKSRHRKGIMGFPGVREHDEEVKIGIERLLRSALNKEHQYPLIIFIDLNIPPTIAKEVFAKEQLNNEVIKIISRIDKKHGKSDKFNMIILTNHPYHYGKADDPCPSINSLAIMGRNPTIKAIHPESIIEIFDAANKYDNIPVDFPIEDV